MPPLQNKKQKNLITTHVQQGRLYRTDITYTKPFYEVTLDSIGNQVHTHTHTQTHTHHPLTPSPPPPQKKKKKKKPKQKHTHTHKTHE